MNFKNQKQFLLLGTILTLILTSAIFTFFIHHNHEQTRNQFIENKLKGDAKSILPHLYQSGNFAWFTANLEEYKKLGLPCLNVTDLNGKFIWGDNKKCLSSLSAKNYVDQKVFDISYTRPEVSVLSTIETNAKSFTIFLIIQILFLGLAYYMLSAMNKRHSKTLIQIESNKRILILTRTLSHNLKSPLAALKTLYALASDKLSPDEKQLLSSIQGNIDMMATRLISQQEEKLPTSAVNISKVIASVIHMKNLELGMASGIYIENQSNSDIYSHVNESDLISILSNLINNCIEARNESQDLRIHLTTSITDNFTNITIQDDGRGIHPAKISELFELDSTTKGFGRGCGLYHAKEIILSWGGTISIASTEGQCTMVQIRLPLVERNKDKEIILIDDEPLNILSWQGMAKKHNLIFNGYSSSDEFYNALPKNKDSVHIYIDYDLGVENGLTLLERLKGEGFPFVSLATGHEDVIKHGVHQVSKSFPFYNY